MDDAGTRARGEVLDGLSNQVGVVLDHAGRVVTLTPAAHVVLGGRLTAGIDFVDIVAADDRADALSLLTASPLDAEIVTLRCAHLDGSYRTFACRSRAAADGELVICADDVTARDRARAELAVHDALLASLQRGGPIAPVFDATVHFAEAAAPGTRAALYRLDGDDMELVAGNGLPTAWTRAAARMPVGENPSPAIAVEPATGRFGELAAEHGLGFTWLVLGSGLPDTQGTPAGLALCVFVGSKRFLTASERTGLIRAMELATTAVAVHEKLVAAHDQASVDSLTGVLGRQPFFDALDAAQRPVTVMVVHVGGVAAVNAAHGYEAGDATLQAVALALQGVVRRRDIVGRLSGATFAIAGPARAADRQAERWADRVREAVHTRLVVAGRVLEPACQVTHVMGPPDLGAAEIVLQAEAQLRGSVTGITDRADAGSGRRFEDR